MAFEKAKAYLEGFGLGDKIIVTQHSSATVTEAAEAIGCEEAMIAKTLSFLQEDLPVLILADGTARPLEQTRVSVSIWMKACAGMKSSILPSAMITAV